VLVLPWTVPGPPVLEVGPIAVTRPGLALGLQIYLKALGILLISLCALLTTPTDELLAALRRLGAPRRLVQIFQMTLRYLNVIYEEFRTMQIALACRGFRNRAAYRSLPALGSVAGALLVRSADRSERVWQAMLSRGYRGEMPTLAARPTTALDVLAAAAAVALAVSLVFLDAGSEVLALP
ncbi:unnamed protein product, partial [marine sediment metagenome]